MSKANVEAFVDIYQQLNKHNLELLNDIYHEEIEFSDPLHNVSGRSQLHSYFSDLYSNVTECTFDITGNFDSGDDAFVYWIMRYRHPKLANNKEITLRGHSHLTFTNDKIIKHQDYFDAAQLLYRNIPILGSVIKLIDRRITKS